MRLNTIDIIILKLMTAVATVGSKFDLLLPCNMLTAVVVRALYADSELKPVSEQYRC